MSCCLLAMWCQDIAMTMLRRVSCSPRCLLFSFCRAVTPVSCLVHVQLTCFSVSDAALFCLLGFPFASQTVGNEAKLCWPAVTCWGAQNSMGECLHATAAAAAAAAHRVLLLPLYFFFCFYCMLVHTCLNATLLVMQTVWKLVLLRSLCSLARGSSVTAFQV